MLQVDKIGINNTLLELGGDSLTAITLTTKVLSKFNVQLNIKDILSNYTIKDMSDYIVENQTKDISKVKIEKVPIQDTYPLSSAQKRIYYSVKIIGEDNIVYISIYDKDNDKYYNEIVKAICDNREDNKKLVIDMVTNMLKKIV